MNEVAMQRKLAVANWKMNGTIEKLQDIESLTKIHQQSQVGIVICPPATLIYQAVQITNNSNLQIGGQNCHYDTSGPYTGDISADMLNNLGARYVIIGHSERRNSYDEQNEDVYARATAAINCNLTVIVCVGETAKQKKQNITLDVVVTQLKECIPNIQDARQLVIAYEPVWAIGTGKIPTINQIHLVHSHMRKQLNKRFGSEIASQICLLYGGSVNPHNATDIFAIPDLDGALVGNSSLFSQDFSSIIVALESSKF